MSKKAREKPAEAGSASVSPYGSVLGYELVTSQPNRLINLIWPECRTWFIGPWLSVREHRRTALLPRGSVVPFSQLALKTRRDVDLEAGSRWMSIEHPGRVVGIDSIGSRPTVLWPI